jgi:hypothetical protein
MKRLLATFAVVLLGAISCGPAEACSQSGSCQGGGSYQSCCTATQCRYLASDGSSFNCNGTDCYTAAQQVIAWCQIH